MSDRVRFLLLAVGHFVLTVMVLLVGLSITMAAFEGEGSGFGAAALLGVFRVLIFPIATFTGDLVMGQGFPLEHMPLVLNSMLWAAVGVWVWRRVSGRAA
jgi:hypothetical protein